MYSKELEELIEAALMDGEISAKEKLVLFKRAEAEGVDLDEFEMVINARMLKLKKESKSSQKSQKLGDIRKCPQCGAVIGSFQMVCQWCGYEFTNVELNNYVETFTKGLEELAQTTDMSKQQGCASGCLMMFDVAGIYEAQRRKILLEQAESRFIKNYPLPMTKEDCVEMLNFILPKLSAWSSNSVTLTWKRKYDAIIQKMEREIHDNAGLRETILSYKRQGHAGKLKMVFFWYKSIDKRIRITFWLFLIYMLLFGGLATYTY